jgi:hypothetical protein
MPLLFAFPLIIYGAFRLFEVERTHLIIPLFPKVPDKSFGFYNDFLRFCFHEMLCWRLFLPMQPAGPLEGFFHFDYTAQKNGMRIGRFPPATLKRWKINLSECAARLPVEFRPETPQYIHNKKP